MHIFAICGSTREQSANKQLLQAIADSYAGQFTMEIFDGLASLPQFNPDLDNDTVPATVTGFRNGISAADGVLICTPEYAMGVPGSLKNALDWTVSTTVFSHKPTALITASSQGYKAHAALMETLLVIECNIPEQARLVIPFIKTKLKGNTVIHEPTISAINTVIHTLTNTING